MNSATKTRLCMCDEVVVRSFTTKQRIRQRRQLPLQSAVETTKTTAKRLRMSSKARGVLESRGKTRTLKIVIILTEKRK